MYLSSTPHPLLSFAESSGLAGANFRKRTQVELAVVSLPQHRPGSAPAKRSMSFVAWLDHSTEDERRVREMIRLFDQPETQDALGFGQVRDAYGDLLFPGTSTLHTRATYLLFIPWCSTAAAAQTSDQVLALLGLSRSRQDRAARAPVSPESRPDALRAAQGRPGYVPTGLRTASSGRHARAARAARDEPEFEPLDLRPPGPQAAKCTTPPREDVQ